MEKLDLTRKYKSYYTAGATPALVTIEKAWFLSVDGQGDPAAPAFNEAVEALYATAYAIKFMFKARGNNFTVAKLEGLWWYDAEQYGEPAIDKVPEMVPRHAWHYRLLIRLPEFVQEQDVHAGIETVIAKKQRTLAKAIQFYEMTEGKAVQALHVGAFDKEWETLTRINDFMRINHLQKNGLHHEIYLSDFRKTAPDKLKTILREPVQ